MQYRTSSYAEDVFDTFYFEKNLQGDIVAIYNASGTKLVSYSYDAWGNHTTTYSNGGANTGAYYNPFRYRGYYYDTELGLYYLNSRYYDANTGRFINADGYVSTGQGLIGNNMYTYCNNNPIMYVDHSGQFPILIGGSAISGTVLVVMMCLSVASAIVSTPEFSNSWNNLCDDVANVIDDGLDALRSAVSTAITWTSNKAKSISKSIADSFAKTKKKPEYRKDTETHHLVAKAAKNATRAAEILNEVLPMGVEDPFNKLDIKTGLHRRLHTNLYYGLVNSIVISAYNAADGDKNRQVANVYAALSAIRAIVSELDKNAPY